MRTVLIVDDNVELASLLAVAVEAHGHRPIVVHDGAGAREALEAETPDAALVDLLLPDVAGGELIAELTARNIPCIAMSGVFRGERFAREALEVHGARAFFEKPFAAREMMAALAQAMSAPVAPAPAELDELPLEQTVEQPAPDGGAPALDDLPTAATTGFFVADPEPVAETAPAAVDEGLGALAFSNRDAWRPQRASARTISPDAAFERAGDLSKTSIARLLTAFYLGQQTGELRVRRGEVIKVVSVEAGVPIYAASNLGSERFARFAVRMGKLPAEQLEAVQREANRAGMRTGEAMIALGLLTEAERGALLEQQVKEILWTLLDWSEGQYTFALGRQTRRDLVKLTLSPGNLILDGFRRMTLVRLRQLVPLSLRVSPTADPPYQLHELTLSGDEAMLLAYADGAKTVEDLLTLADLDERSALALVHGLVQLGILEPRKHLPSNRRVVLV